MKGNVLRAVELSDPSLPEPAPALRLDIGCGKTTPDGWIGIDTLDFGQKHVFDVAELSKLWYQQHHKWMMGERATRPDASKYVKWNFEDSSVDEVRSSHFVEHLTGEQRVFFFSELFRIMKPKATALIITPNWSHSCAYGDPTHQWPPMSQWWPLYLHGEWRGVNAPHVDSDADYDHVVAGSWDASIESRAPEAKSFMMNHYTNAWRDLIVTLTSRKPV